MIESILNQNTSFQQLALNSLPESEYQHEEEKAADAWKRKMAFVLVSHEFGLVFEALAEGLKSKSAELRSPCFVAATCLQRTLKAKHLPCWLSKVSFMTLVWAGTGNNLHLVPEIREHTKAVTSLYILQSGERFYSGSLDKTASGRGQAWRLLICGESNYHATCIPGP
ncbi:hypothetical protein V6N12_070126 [Hibiscus sabdariffa]|uniref:Putative E3 ubiquitin-protein ligase LIN ARM-like domain-containing protein n=1 Tax=Hibiscus sabdariffa TaxID=183260 RepID=A0ABR2FFW4_9ROSI